MNPYKTEPLPVYETLLCWHIQNAPEKCIWQYQRVGNAIIS
jgi:hypothetical protein